MPNPNYRPSSYAHLFNALPKQKDPLDADTVLVAVLQEFGGLNPFLREVRREYDAAPSGSAQRRNILMLVLNLVVSTAAKRKEEPRKPSDMSDDELMKTFEQCMEKANRGMEAPKPKK